jgi:translation initiation factor IF-1
MDRPRQPPTEAEEPAANDRVAEGRVMELLPSQLVRVELDGRHQVTAHFADPVRRNFVRVLVGDRVRVVLMAHDPTRARIVEKL